MPRVTVVIPAYNAEAFLPDTIDSVEAQTYHDWEVVVADDASTDRTAEVVESRSGRFRAVRSDVNEGPAGARNRALREVSGELVAFLDADDLWLPTFLERMVTAYDGRPDHGARVGVVSCDALVLGPSGYEPRTYKELMGVPDEVTLSAMLVKNPIQPSGALTSMAVVNEVGGFCDELFGTEDYDLWLRIVEAGYEVVVVPEPLYVYRMSPTSVSSNLPRIARSLQATFRRALERNVLSSRERRIAERQLRLQRALEQVGLAMDDRRSRERYARRVARYLPLFVRVAIENPDRWGDTVRILAGRGSPLSQVGKSSLAVEHPQGNRPHERPLAGPKPDGVVEAPVGEQRDQGGAEDTDHRVERE
jgi:glycosyltransferase involved in cell wall biosynthesis